MLTAFALLALGSTGSPQEPAEARPPLAPEPVRALELPQGEGLGIGPTHRLVVKFVDGARVRFPGGSELSSKSGADLDAPRTIAEEEGLTFRALIRLDEEVLQGLEARAAARSGVSQPDLAGMAVVEVPTTDPRELERVGERLQALEQVEFACIETLGTPPPEDLPPTTRDLVSFQTYRGPNPGMNVDYAWSVGARGAGIKLSDCEYGWDPEHEDLRDIDLHLEPGQTIHPTVFANNWDDHGTAVLGETSSVPNAYGTSGMAPEAEVYTWPEWTVEEGSRRVTCITNAIAASAPGDVVLLEMQTTGAGGGYGPAELNMAVWTVVKAGTDAGVVVVGAAGNGNQNLDGSAYNDYMNRGDSGAILVGAGSPNTSHSKLSFSTYGSRIDLQGWGQSVFTLGYGGYAKYGGDDRQTYTSSFSGTSSASPFVASACVILQGLSKASGSVLSPTDLRSLLIATGIPQGSGGHIGPFPDLQAAIEALSTCPLPQGYCTSTPNSSGSPATLSSSGTTSIVANDLVLVVEDAAANQFGYYFYGTEEQQVPLGDGFLCVDGSLFRLVPALKTDASGSGSWFVDYNAPPMGGGAGEITVGSTWKFQFWFRDPPAGGSGSNLSNGLSVTFCD